MGEVGRIPWKPITSYLVQSILRVVHIDPTFTNLKIKTWYVVILPTNCDCKSLSPLGMRGEESTFSSSTSQHRYINITLERIESHVTAI